MIYLLLIPVALIIILVLLIRRRGEKGVEMKVVRLKDIKNKGVMAEVEEELEDFERVEEEEEEERKIEEIVIANAFGEIVYTTGRDRLVDPFYVFPYADRIIVESDKFETFVKLENGFIYIKANRPVDVNVARRIARKVIKAEGKKSISKIVS